jgi:hypothetical protein
MGIRENPFDISGELDVKSQKVVSREVTRIFTGVEDRNVMPRLAQPLAGFPPLCFGERPYLLPSDAPYHDPQHVPDVTPAISPEGLGVC